VAEAVVADLQLEAAAEVVEPVLGPEQVVAEGRRGKTMSHRWRGAGGARLGLTGGGGGGAGDALIDLAGGAAEAGAVPGIHCSIWWRVTGGARLHCWSDGRWRRTSHGSCGRRRAKEAGLDGDTGSGMDATLSDGA